MISGNRMPRKGEQAANRQMSMPNNIHRLSDVPTINSGEGDGFKVIKPKLANRNKIDSSLLQKVPAQPGVSKPSTIKREEEKKPTFQSSARHGVKIGGMVIGKDKWQCKICKQVNSTEVVSCIRCESEKGEVKNPNEKVQQIGKPSLQKKPIINKQKK